MLVNTFYVRNSLFLYTIIEIQVLPVNPHHFLIGELQYAQGCDIIIEKMLMVLSCERKEVSSRDMSRSKPRIYQQHKSQQIFIPAATFFRSTITWVLH